MSTLTPCFLKEASTFLFVPANRPERISKAMLSGTDVVIADLEDAVAPAEKTSARQMLIAWLDQHPTQQLLVRINSTDTSWHEADVLACQHPGIRGVVLPKAETAQAISPIHTVCNKPVLPIVETARGMIHLEKIARTQGVCRLLFGKLDLALELNLDPDENASEEMTFLPYRAQLVLMSKLHHLAPPVEGVYTIIDDMAGLQRYTRRSKRHGFGGVLLIHPKQVDTVKQVFMPTELEMLWARKVIAALEKTGGGTASVDGKMVDAPVIARARRIMAHH